jgi:hypothetical protein
MSSRFHNKYHRHNHHSASFQDPKYPDAGHDPIASYDSPFLGDFVMLGTLSAVTAFQGPGTNKPAGVFVTGLSGSPVALQAVGDVLVEGNLSANNIVFTGNLINTYSAPVTASGVFLELVINNTLYGIRLWNLP